MSHWNRLIYAFALTAAVGGIFIIVSAIAAPEVMIAFIRQPYWVAIFVLSYLVAPFVGRYIKRE
jgi:hypothetical protein